MSQKINIGRIVSEHFKSMTDTGGAASRIDLLTFIGLPLLLALLGMAMGVKLSGDTISLFVNFGSIFTALLLSVLVLVYDQENKLSGLLDQTNIEKVRLSSIEANNESVREGAIVFARESKIALQMELLKELYHNLSYAILASVVLVLLCFIHSVFDGMGIGELIERYIIGPCILFLILNLFLTILMVVKRLYALLTASQ